VFVASSSEGLAIANAVCLQLELETEPTLWSRDVFLPSDYPLERLEDQLSRYSFAVLVASPDDALIKRGKLYPAMRDNLLLEFGLFAGALGRKHAFFICPSAPKIELPSDLLGVITATYNSSRIPNKIAGSAAALRQAVNAPCRQVLKVIKQESALMRRDKADEVRELQRSKKYQAAQKIYTVASRLFTRTQREALTCWSDPKAFRKMKDSAAQEINEFAKSLREEAKLLGLERHLEQIKVVTTAAISDVPYFSMARFEKKEIAIGLKAATLRPEGYADIARLRDRAIEVEAKIDAISAEGAAAAQELKAIKELEIALSKPESGANIARLRDRVTEIETKIAMQRDAIVKEINAKRQDAINTVTERYERWRNKHWPRLEQASQKMNDALAKVLLEMGHTGTHSS
jgi:hypothetical protein